MTEHSNLQRKIKGLSTLAKVCIGFGLLVILVAFFNLDFDRVLTPFLLPFLWLFLVAVYIFLVIASLVLIPIRFRKVSWRAFLPLIINGIAFLVIWYLFFPLQHIREDLEFIVKRRSYEKVIVWVNESLENGGIALDRRNNFIDLPDQYHDAAYGGRIIVEKNNDNLSIFFPIDNGMFEYWPGFMYRSNGIAPPDGTLYSELECETQQSPYWYICH